jgi:hypothetical protein
MAILHSGPETPLSLMPSGARNPGPVPSAKSIQIARRRSSNSTPSSRRPRRSTTRMERRGSLRPRPRRAEEDVRLSRRWRRIGGGERRGRRVAPAEPRGETVERPEWTLAMGHQRLYERGGRRPASCSHRPHRGKSPRAWRVARRSVPSRRTCRPRVPPRRTCAGT